MNININETLRKWDSIKSLENSIWFTGFFWIEDKLYERKNAIDYIQSQLLKDHDEEENKAFLNQLNGQWAFICQNKDSIIAAVDHIRSIPIFYMSNKEQIIVSDDSHYLANTCKLDTFSNDNITAYLNQYTSFSGETILEHLFDVEAGEYIHIKNNVVTKTEYWKFPSKRVSKNKPVQEDIDEITQCFDTVFKLMIYYLHQKNQRVYLPLSGGMDSRLLAWALKKYEFKGEVIAYTYGQSMDDEEVRISQQVANELGLKWEFIQYTKQTIQELYTDICKNYKKLNIEKSMPHLQDWVAIKFLVNKYGQGLVLPGLCFDVLAGLTIPNDLIINTGCKAADLICNLWDINQHYSFKINSKSNDQLSNYEHYRKNNRLAAYIVNSVRIYELLGCEYYLPYWDLSLTNLWYSLPNEWRYQRNIFRMYLNQIYTGDFKELLNIPIASNRTLLPKYIQITWKQKIKVYFQYARLKLSENKLLGYFNFMAPKKEKSQFSFLGRDKEDLFKQFEKEIHQAKNQYIINVEGWVFAKWIIMKKGFVGTQV